ncbi:hypothetical protein [Oceanicoccus sagamiensis]|uniref:Uncharacterized protein n=1 Tax=Oceanicoccus sagamiensis TaxID=716816 RepID=A0A1X9NBA1_9GAMM|nr:hypothetical protein [Oceanicoccus sagamiensis]ARN74886.1 hypothetical protein BST96_12635 [Oceanicoccus sagamiensis]
MLKQTLALLGLIHSLSVNAVIVDLGSITRDTSTGLDWLDLTETNGRSYVDVSGKLGEGQEFDGWRYASVDEAQALWKNFGISSGTMVSISRADTLQYNSLVVAVDVLGNSVLDIGDNYFDFGAIGFTADTVFNDSGEALYQKVSGFFSNPNEDYVNAYSPDAPALFPSGDPVLGVIL